mmetsp:Transcript_9393/g.23780  ORF Transcript_9393/g.23780 Transcript_9393/m.23780 type:complete len:346 (-) Transcript_9393:731-1768(-)
MAEARGLHVAVAVEHLHQVHAHVTQVLHRASHILDQHRRAGLARRAHNGDETLAHVPKDVILLGHLREGVCLQRLRRRLLHAKGEPGGLERVADLVDASLQVLWRPAAALHQQGCSGGVQLPSEPLHQLAQVLADVTGLQQRRIVKHLHGVDGGLGAQDVGGLAGDVDVGEHDEGRRLVGPLGHCVDGGLADKAKRALAADHQAFHNLERLVRREVHQRIEAVASGALDGELAADEVGQLAVCLHAARQRLHARQQVRMALLESLAASRVRGVQHGAVHQNDARVLERVVRVLAHAAAHAARVVGHNAANHAAVDGGGVGADLVLHVMVALALVGRQDAVHLATD